MIVEVIQTILLFLGALIALYLSVKFFLLFVRVARWIREDMKEMIYGFVGEKHSSKIEIVLHVTMAILFVGAAFTIIMRK